jgi:dipeptidyl aminopeptidase/acylaminoacyl peptidase
MRLWRVTTCASAALLGLAILGQAPGLSSELASGPRPPHLRAAGGLTFPCRVSYGYASAPELCYEDDPLTAEKVPTHDPDWTADGTRLAFERGGTIYARGAWLVFRGEMGSVWEGRPRRVVSGYDPSWSPSGAQLAYWAKQSGNPDIYVARDDGGGVRRLTSSSDDDLAPAWSPNGRTIAYTRGSTIRLVEVDGSRDRRLGDGSHADWSVNGKRLAFSHQGDIWVANADGSGRRNLTRTPDIQDSAPSWSPDGRAVIAYVGRASSSEIGLYAVSLGGRVTRVLAEPLRDRPPLEFALDWQPVRVLVATVSDRKPILSLRDAHGKLVNTLRPGCYAPGYVDRSKRHGITFRGFREDNDEGMDPFGARVARRTVKLVGSRWAGLSTQRGCSSQVGRGWLRPGTYRYLDPANPRIRGSFRVTDRP